MATPRTAPAPAPSESAPPLFPRETLAAAPPFAASPLPAAEPPSSPSDRHSAPILSPGVDFAAGEGTHAGGDRGVFRRAPTPDLPFRPEDKYTLSPPVKLIRFLEIVKLGDFLFNWSMETAAAGIDCLPLDRRRRNRSPSSSTTSSSAQPATSACAACKYQRRKCNPDCTLAPYFPADQHNQFLNAHRLFGVSNILKIIKHLDNPRRHEAMRSIIQQSNLRAHDPVGGCYRVILELQRQIEYSSAELAIVLRQLAHYHAQAESAAVAVYMSTVSCAAACNL